MFKKKLVSINQRFSTKTILFFAYIALSIITVYWINGLITDKPIVSDAKQNLKMGYHLYENGVLSNDSEYNTSPSPSNYREPVPPIVNAIVLYLHPGIDKDDTYKSLQNGINTKKIKQTNLFWILLLLIGVGYLTYIISMNFYLPFLTYLLVLTYFVRFGNHFDSLTTELPAAALIILVTVLQIQLIRKNSYKLFLITGIISGLLILTKAVFLYLFIAFLPFLYLFFTRDKKLIKNILFVGGILLILGPWLFRNYTIYKEISVTQRAGAVLDLRASYNQITKSELPGAIYLWGPETFKKIARKINLNPKSRQFKRGGKYQRLQKEHAIDSVAIELGLPRMGISYFAKSRAEINQLQDKLGTDGKEGSRYDVYKIMESTSKKQILDHPAKHIFLSALFFWRGIWCFPNSTLPFVNETIKIAINDLINFLSVLSLFSVFFVSLYKRDYEWLALTILPVGMMLIHAIATQYLPRMSEPLIPSMLVCLSLLLLFSVERINNRLGLH